MGHAARTKRLVQVATSLIQSPAASIPKAITDPAQAKAAYRFLSNPAVTAQGVLSGHYQATAQRCLQCEAVLLLQDTTTLTFNSRAALRDLGPTNDGSKTKGFFAHTSLAVDAASHEVLGILHQHIWIRSRNKKPAKETLRQRKKRHRESQHWGENQEHAAEVLREACQESGQLMPRVIAVFDREGDVFEAMESLDQIGHSFVIRAQRNRLLDDDDPDAKRYSLDEVRTARVMAYKQVQVRARGGRPARTAQLQLRAMTAQLRPPVARSRQGESLTVNIVLAQEIGAPEDVEPLCWYLVTRESIATEKDVLQVVRHYEARWIIEELHMGLKTGCACEDRQMETAHALMNFLALASPMAVQLLQLRNAARREAPLEECTMLGPSEMAVLRGLRPRMMAKVTNARQLMRVVANFGGFLNRNSDPDPGWRTLWRGFEAVKLAAKGYDLRGRAAKRNVESRPRDSQGKRFGQ
jgi:hypothetical protein